MNSEFTEEEKRINAAWCDKEAAGYRPFGRVRVIKHPLMDFNTFKEGYEFFAHTHITNPEYYYIASRGIGIPRENCRSQQGVVNE
jgi:hypothetical protein